jgi:hypothetical protein
MDFTDWLRTDDAADMIEKVKSNIKENKVMTFNDLTSNIKGSPCEIIACVYHLREIDEVTAIRIAPKIQYYLFIQSKTREVVLEKLKQIMNTLESPAKFEDLVYNSTDAHMHDIINFCIMHLGKTGYIECIDDRGWYSDSSIIIKKGE